jgi:hypothetical protein
MSTAILGRAQLLWPEYSSPGVRAALLELVQVLVQLLVTHSFTGARTGTGSTSGTSTAVLKRAQLYWSEQSASGESRVFLE